MRRRIPVVAGVVVAVVVLGWYLALWRPASSHLRAAQTATAAARTRQRQLDTELANLRSIQRTLPGLRSDLSASGPALPASAAIGDIIDQINGLCVRDSITWTDESQTVSALASSPDAGSAVVALTLGVAGSYPDMVAFVTALLHLPRLIVVDSLAYGPGAGTGVTATMSARAFYDTTPVPSLPAAVATR